MTAIWVMVYLIVFTFLPGLELRASIPLAFFNSAWREALSLPFAIAVCFVANCLVGILTFWLMGPVVTIFRRWSWFNVHVWPRLEQTQHKLHPYVEKYGELGLAIFIGVPLPGTGAYSGAFGAYLLGLDKRKFFIANILGVLLAGIAVTAICLLLDQGLVAEDSIIRKLFIKQVNVHV